jgi:hypothetical protein
MNLFTELREVPYFVRRNKNLKIYGKNEIDYSLSIFHAIALSFYGESYDGLLGLSYFYMCFPNMTVIEMEPLVYTDSKRLQIICSEY